jgi:hypothetical protein
MDRAPAVVDRKPLSDVRSAAYIMSRRIAHTLKNVDIAHCSVHSGTLDRNVRATLGRPASSAKNLNCPFREENSAICPPSGDCN